MAIKDLEPEESYKYVGVTEGDGIQNSSMKEEEIGHSQKLKRLTLKFVNF